MVCSYAKKIECTKQDFVQRPETYRELVQLEQYWCYMFPFVSACHQTCSTVVGRLSKEGDIL